MSDSVRPHWRQPTKFPRPWDSPGKNTGVGCHFLLQYMKVELLSRVQLLVTPWTAAYQAPPSMRFSRQEYWSGVPLPSPILYAQAWTISRSLCWAIPGAFPKPLDSNEIQPCTQKLMILFMTIKIDFILVLKKILVFLYMLTPSGSF